MNGDEQWTTLCPQCGADGELVVVEAVLVGTGERLRFRSLLYADGFSVPVEDIRDCSTEDELVECGSCGARLDLADLVKGG